MYRIIAINLGSTSSKIAYYEDQNCLFKETINHPLSELEQFPTIWDQFDYRREAILRWMEEKGLKVEDMDAVVSRGGHTEPIVGGVYRITEKMLEQSASEKYGNHATDLGIKIAADFSRWGLQAFTVDPPVTDEFEELARFSGLPQIRRRSSFHVLNQRAAGRQYAKDKGKKYETLKLIGVHMGGGISVAVHSLGKLIDANNAIDGDGPFSTNRCGSLPAGDLARLCFSGDYTYQEIKKMLNGKGGLVAYVGRSDVRSVEEAAMQGDEKCRTVLDAMIYQISREIGASAAVLCGEVDAVILTGGIANSRYVVSEIKKRIGFLGEVAVYPGEFEMQSLALNALAALRGETEIRTM